METTSQSTMTIDQNEYEERIIAFADILGWRKTIKSDFKIPYEAATLIEKYAKNFSLLMKEEIKNAPGIPDKSKEQYSSIEFSFFSDSFAISAPVDNGKVIFDILAWASDMLLRKKFLIRGGVTIGDLYHRQGLIFGPALVEVVEIEENDAIYPRFICSDKLIKYLDSAGFKDEVILEDFPESWVVNVANGSLIVCDELLTIIKNELSMSDKSERVMRKWRYIQEMLPKMYERSIS